MILLNRGYDKMTRIDKKYYINVKELMLNALPKPKHKTTIIVNDGEFLPIIRVSAWQ